jgi:adenylate cyclase
VDEKVEPAAGVLEVKRAGLAPTWKHLRAREGFRVGRGEENELVLDDALVSRLHAVFNGSASGVILSDLSSLNGTYLNGRRITTPVTLQAGDVVRIGVTTIAFHPGAAGDSTTSSRAPGTLMEQMRRVVVSVLIADVCNFTVLSEQLSPHDVAAMLQLWFGRVSETVEEFGGEVDKYIGDCVMALWRGVESDQQVLALRSAAASLAILVRTDSLSASGAWPYRGSNPWRCRVSLNSGVALMGTFGHTRTRDFTVFGDTVNVAFRLNDLAGKVDRNILLGVSTARLIENEFALEPLGLTPVEGRVGAVEIFGLLGRKETAVE